MLQELRDADNPEWLSRVQASLEPHDNLGAEYKALAAAGIVAVINETGRPDDSPLPTMDQAWKAVENPLLFPRLWRDADSFDSIRTNIGEGRQGLVRWEDSNGARRVINAIHYPGSETKFYDGLSGKVAELPKSNPDDLKFVPLDDYPIAPKWLHAVRASMEKEDLKNESKAMLAAGRVVIMARTGNGEESPIPSSAEVTRALGSIRGDGHWKAADSFGQIRAEIKEGEQGLVRWRDPDRTLRLIAAVHHPGSGTEFYDGLSGKIARLPPEAEGLGFAVVRELPKGPVLEHPVAARLPTPPAKVVSDYWQGSRGGRRASPAEPPAQPTAVRDDHGRQTPDPAPSHHTSPPPARPLREVINSARLAQQLRDAPGAAAELRARNLEADPVDGDGDCLMYAVIRASPPSLPEGGTTVQDMRTGIADLAGRILESPASKEREGLVLMMTGLSTEMAGRELAHSRLNADEFQMAKNELANKLERNPGKLRNELVKRLGTRTKYDGVEGDIAPFMVAQAYDLKLIVIHADGRVGEINPQGTHSVTLVKLTHDHWDATKPRRGGVQGNTT